MSSSVTTSPVSLNESSERSAHPRAVLLERVRQMAPFLAALVGCACVVASFWPGYMSSDSLDQLSQGRSGIFSGSHPAIMAWLWGLLDRIIPGPAGMLLLQSAVFWLGLALVVTASVRHAAAPLLVLAVGLLPPVIALLGTIWKDTQMGVALFLAVGLLLTLRSRFSWTAFVGATALLLYANAVRSNGPTGVLPLGIYAGVLLARRLFPSRPVWTHFLVAGAFFVGLHFSGGMINRTLVGERKGHPYQAPLLHDLVGLSINSGKNLLPEYVQSSEHGVSLEQLVPLYQPESLDPLFFTPGSSIRQTSDPAQLAVLRSQWLSSVRTYPHFYFKNRWALFSVLLGVRGDVEYPYHWQVDPNSLGVEFKPGILNKAVMSVLHATRNSLLFRVWLYLLAALAAIGVSLWQRRWGLTATVAMSALFYVLPYFWVAPVPSFRYGWWCVLAGVLLPFVFTAERRSERVPITQEAA